MKNNFYKILVFLVVTLSPIIVIYKNVSAWFAILPILFVLFLPFVEHYFEEKREERKYKSQNNKKKNTKK